MKRPISLMLVCVLSLPLETFAQNSQTIRITIGDLHVPALEMPQRDNLREALFEAIPNDPRVKMIPFSNISKWRDRERRLKEPKISFDQLKEAREFLTDGKKYYEALQFDKALPKLKEARKQFILNLQSLRANRDLIDSHLYLGMTYVALNQIKMASEEFRKVVYLDPKRELSGKEYSPPVRESFSKTRQEVMSYEPVKLRVESTPAGGSIYLNGKTVGQTPLELKLQPGEYFILIEKKGNKTWYKPVSLQNRREIIQATMGVDEEDLEWSHLFRVREGEEGGRDETQVLKMANAVGADLVFFGTLERLREYRLLGQWFDARSSELSQVAVVNIGADLSGFESSAADLMETMLGFVRPDGHLITSQKPDLSIPQGPLTVGGADRPPDVLVTPPQPKKWYERWWIYPLLAGAGVGVFLGARQIGSTGGSKVVIDNQGNF